MKKVGIIIFISAVVIGVIIANFFSFGRASHKIFNFSFNSTVKGSGVSASEIRDISGFEGVDVGGIFNVEITARENFEVEVSADDNLLPLIETYVSNGVLRIETKERINSHTPIHVRISAPDIKTIEASGASKVSLSNVQNSGLKLDTSGASKVRIEGETANLMVEVSGASNIDAERLRAEKADIDASGASHVNVNVSGDLKSDASGASKIVYSGNPKNVEKKTSGASHVTQK